MPSDERGLAVLHNRIETVDLKTGQPRWPCQPVHHPNRDFEVSSEAILAVVTVDSESRGLNRAKQGFLYVFDRVKTGVAQRTIHVPLMGRHCSRGRRLHGTPSRVAVRAAEWGAVATSNAA